MEETFYFLLFILSSSETSIAMAYNCEPTIKFLPVTEGSSKIGACALCHRRGFVGWFCYKCCSERGEAIGCCDGEENNNCNRCGLLEEHCVDCGPYMIYEDCVPSGKCVTCGADGTMYKKCVMCKDNTSTYEFHE
jgi:hypothetical protein